MIVENCDRVETLSFLIAEFSAGQMAIALHCFQLLRLTFCDSSLSSLLSAVTFACYQGLTFSLIS